MTETIISTVLRPSHATATGTEIDMREMSQDPAGGTEGRPTSTTPAMRKTIIPAGADMSAPHRQI